MNETHLPHHHDHSSLMMLMDDVEGVDLSLLNPTTTAASNQNQNIRMIPNTTTTTHHNPTAAATVSSSFSSLERSVSSSSRQHLNLLWMDDNNNNNNSTNITVEDGDDNSNFFSSHEYLRCRVCGFGGCDVRVRCEHGCACHTRCLRLNADASAVPMAHCPMCHLPTTSGSLVLLPMSFREMDEARCQRQRPQSSSQPHTLQTQPPTTTTSEIGSSPPTSPNSSSNKKPRPHYNYSATSTTPSAAANEKSTSTGSSRGDHNVHNLAASSHPLSPRWTRAVSVSTTATTTTTTEDHPAAATGAAAGKGARMIYRKSSSMSSVSGGGGGGGAVGGSSSSSSSHRNDKESSKKSSGKSGNSGCTSRMLRERRTGRWSVEEIALCDQLMQCFAEGQLPIPNGVKLNEFLGSMLKSKQSRLTKKMKNAKLSTQVYHRQTGYLEDADRAREFSHWEEQFLLAVADESDRAEMKFHMQKEWREQFTQMCAALGQPLDADRWLSSVEEMDRRASQAQDAARMAKRKLMMGFALHTDTQNTDEGVFIERSANEFNVLNSVVGEHQLGAAAAVAAAGGGSGGSGGGIFGSDTSLSDEDLINLWMADATEQQQHGGGGGGGSHSNSTMAEVNGKSSLLHAAPFLAKVTAYLQRHYVPFEHVDVWVPSYIGESDGSTASSCRLCYAGSATTDKVVVDDLTELSASSNKSSRLLSADESFHLLAFGDYSQKFSFAVGHGLPGRVYESGRPTWEQCVHNAPHAHFERCGGARLWGIRTVLGIPIASPNVGRIVVTFYSCFDRPKDEDLVVRLSDECTKLMPSPKWKLVVDIGNYEELMPVSASSLASVATQDGYEQQGLEQQNNQSSLTAQQHPSSHFNSDMLLSDPDSLTAAASTSTIPNLDKAQQKEDPRVDAVIAMLGEFMPTDPSASAASFLNSFMSLRLLLLRPSKNPGEDELIRTILDSYSSYSSGGRVKSDIAIMLARDFNFLSQQQLPQLGGSSSQEISSPIHFSSLPDRQSSKTSSEGLSVFCLPSISSSLQNSPALTPILPVSGIFDELSIVSN